MHGCRRAPIEQEGGGSSGFNQIGWRHERMEQQGANCIVDGAEHVFSFAILLRGVGALEA